MGNIRRTDVIRLAKKYADECYTEGSNNWTIFSQILDDCNYYTPQKKQGQPWCHNFINAIFLLCSDSEEDARKYDAQNYLGEQPPVNNLSCGCTFGADYFRAIGQFYDIEDAYVGDIIYFGERGHESHVGLIVDLDYNDDGRITTIHTVEGNKADAVRYGEYSINSTYIAGVGKATFFDYYDDLEDNEPEPDPTPEPVTEKVIIELDVLRRGDVCGQVNTVKALLNGYGFRDWNGNALDLDGHFDDLTEYVVKNYQTAYGLQITGTVTAETWRLLLL